MCTHFSGNDFGEKISIDLVGLRQVAKTHSDIAFPKFVTAEPNGECEIANLRRCGVLREEPAAT
jgi:hypothetical protein